LNDLLRRVHHPKEEVTIALVGKYIDLPDAYLSVAEALRAGGFAHQARVHLRWIPSDECETPAGAARNLHDVDAVCVPGGFGIRGIEGKLGALSYARTLELEHLRLTDEPAYAQSAEVTVWTTTALHFLQVLHRADPGRADTAAREAYAMWKDRALLAALPLRGLVARGPVGRGQSLAWVCHRISGTAPDRCGVGDQVCPTLGTSGA
jgi:hypothetical protein